MTTTADERLETSETVRAYGESWDVLLRQPRVGVGSYNEPESDLFYDAEELARLVDPTCTNTSHGTDGARTLRIVRTRFPRTARTAARGLSRSDSDVRHERF